MAQSSQSSEEELFLELKEIHDKIKRRWYSLDRSEKKELFAKWDSLYEKFKDEVKKSNKDNNGGGKNSSDLMNVGADDIENSSNEIQERRRKVDNFHASVQAKYRSYLKNKPRTRGCEKPFNSNQYRAWFMHLSSVIIYFISVGLILMDFPTTFSPLQQRQDSTQKTSGDSNFPIAAFFIMQLCSLVVGLVAWIYLELVDPAVPAGPIEHTIFRCIHCMPTLTNQPKWCSVCRKATPGMEHHCMWLGTCVGYRTYPAFIIHVSAGVVQFFSQGFLQLIWFLTLYILPSENQTAVNNTTTTMSSTNSTTPTTTTSKGNPTITFNSIFISIGALYSFGLFFAYLPLLLFHSMLCIRGLTTMEWMAEQADKKAARRRRKSSIQKSFRRKRRAKQQLMHRKQQERKKRDDTNI
eukprot:g1710.t1